MVSICSTWENLQPDMLIKTNYKLIRRNEQSCSISFKQHRSTQHSISFVVCYILLTCIEGNRIWSKLKIYRYVWTCCAHIGVPACFFLFADHASYWHHAGLQWLHFEYRRKFVKKYTVEHPRFEVELIHTWHLQYLQVACKQSGAFQTKTNPCKLSPTIILDILVENDLSMGNCIRRQTTSKTM